MRILFAFTCFVLFFGLGFAQNASSGTDQQAGKTSTQLPLGTLQKYHLQEIPNQGKFFEMGPGTQGNGGTTSTQTSTPQGSGSQSSLGQIDFGKTNGRGLMRRHIASLKSNLTQAAQNRQLSLDGRNLPLNEGGQLLSVDGYPVDFVRNPSDPGICATPYPMIRDEYVTNRLACPLTVACDNPANRDANIPLAGDPLKWVSCRWTIVRNGGASTNIDSLRAVDLMNELNADFLPWRIQFCTDTIIFIEDPTWYNHNSATEEFPMKNALGANTVDVCNVYVVNQITNPAAGGYARFPYDPTGGTSATGGIVLARGNCFVGTHTLAHEMGHTFGLYHTFHGVDEVSVCSACYERTRNANGSANTTGAVTPQGGPFPDEADAEGDLCSDTNPHRTNANVCGNVPGSNGCDAFSWLNPPVNNHMSYSFCTTQFTSRQAGRMHCMMDTYLNSWLSYGNTVCGGAPPIADFTGAPTFGISPVTVTFTDLSTPQSTLTAWSWNFDVTGIGGAVPATFNGQVPPQVVYSTADTCYTVSLTVTNANGSDTETKTFFVCVTSVTGGADCDTINHVDTPPNQGIFAYAYGPNDYVTGRPNTDGYLAFYEQFFVSGTNNSVCRIDIALGNIINNSGNLSCRLAVYPDSATTPGIPDISNPLYLGTSFGPDTLWGPGFPGPGFYGWYPFSFCTPIELGNLSSFHIGIEILSGTFTGGSPDRLTLMSTNGLTGGGDGQNLGLNNQLCLFGCGGPNFNDYLTNAIGPSLNFDLCVIPVLGELAPVPVLNSLFVFPFCDVTAALYVDTFFCSTPELWEFDFSSGVTITDTSYAGIDSILVAYYQNTSDTLIITTTNACGRVDATGYIITIPVDTTPAVDFSRSPTGDICAGTTVTFTATPAGLAFYDWDFGDGTTQLVAGVNTVNHTYATPGLYYTSLEGIAASGCFDDELKYDYVRVLDCSTNPPIGGFIAFPDSGCIPWTLTLTDTSFGIPVADSATSWYWDFGDGNFSVARNPTHIYNSPGTFTVMQVAWNAGGSDTSYYTVKSLPLPCTLPIRTQLKATPVNASAMLKWRSADPAENGKFRVERSFNGADFQAVGTVLGREYDSPGTYTFLDRGVGEHTEVFYRIRSVDQNGLEEFSNVETVNFLNADPLALEVYPNPLGKGILLNVSLLADHDGTVRMQIMDLQGRVLNQEVHGLAEGENHFKMDLSKLSPGAYLLDVSSGGSRQIKRIVIE
ncbi:MAG: PKD domain-containing protein [Bacteroidia bacterium]|nr:PKD domain-containing protein [Bacteroidia bacterium]